MEPEPALELPLMPPALLGVPAADVPAPDVPALLGALPALPAVEPSAPPLPPPPLLPAGVELPAAPDGEPALKAPAEPNWEFAVVALSLPQATSAQQPRSNALEPRRTIGENRLKGLVT
ncbi:MAG TPA: hypothetical protein VGC79_13235 [Polyangiaceae bacterium]